MNSQTPVMVGGASVLVDHRLSSAFEQHLAFGVTALQQRAASESTGMIATEEAPPVYV